MKKAFLLVVGLFLFSLPALAGEYLMNDTGETVTELRVTFSEPVTITGFGDTLMTVEPQGKATEFVFSGGELEAWGGHWVNWEPTSATLQRHEWLKSTSASPMITITSGMSKVPDTPVVEGVLMNPAYFAHPAYVMQGVSDRDAVFAMPLNGIEELAFYPVVDGVDLEDVIWSVEVTYPDGIGVNIQDDTLYIWGTSSSWSGYGEVTLKGVTSDGHAGSVTIPVTVFRKDRTLINVEGKPNYFVPWSPQLDINRILSVEEHMRKYNKDEGSLDRTIQWSRYRPLTFMAAVNAGCRWLNAHSLQGWNDALQYQTVDLAFDELQRLHVNWIKIDPLFYMWRLDSTEVVRIYDSISLGPSWTDEDIRYVIDEAHRRGIRVMGSLQLWPLRNGTFYGPGRQEMRPSSWSAWMGSYTGVVQELASIWEESGVDVACPGVELFNLSEELTGTRYITGTEWNDSMVRLVKEVRTVYDGPVTWAPAVLPIIIHDDTAYQRMLPLFRELDFLGFNAYFFPLTTNPNPDIGAVTQGWRDWQARVIQPIVDRLGKPYVFTEVGGESKDGLLRNGPMQARGTLVDLGEQVLLYESVVAAFFSEPDFFGAYWWEYSLNAAAPTDAIGGYDDGECTFRLKPAEQVIERAYAGEVRQAAATLDGDSKEWVPAQRVAKDPVGDSLDRDVDLIAIFTATDEWYQYVAVELQGGLDSSSYLHVLIDAHGDSSPNMGIYIDRRGSFGALRGGTSRAPLYGYVDVATSPDRTWFELRVPWALVPQDMSQSLRVEIWSAEANAVVDSLATPRSAAFVLAECGGYTSKPDEVLTGQRSVHGSYVGNATYTPYFRTDPYVLQLSSHHTYRVTFDYYILVPNEKGFETLFYSPRGGREGKWLPSITLRGAAGSSGSATLTATLLDFSDYEIRWNIVATGTIVIDNIIITDLTTGEVVASEDAEE